MAGDNLFVLLSQLRDDLPEVSDATWDRLKLLLSDRAGTERVYVPRAAKRARLEQLAATDAQESSERLSQILGVSARHVRRLRRLR
jgi:hypothetical protein